MGLCAGLYWLLHQYYTIKTSLLLTYRNIAPCQSTCMMSHPYLVVDGTMWQNDCIVSELFISLRLSRYGKMNSTAGDYTMSKLSAELQVDIGVGLHILEWKPFKRLCWPDIAYHPYDRDVIDQVWHCKISLVWYWHPFWVSDSRRFIQGNSVVTLKWIVSAGVVMVLSCPG